MPLNHVALGEGDAARARLREASAHETEWQDDASFARVQVADPTATASSCS